LVGGFNVDASRADMASRHRSICGNSGAGTKYVAAAL
jgi:hypothetical protein